MSSESNNALTAQDVQTISAPKMEAWKTKTLLTGALLGATAGLLSAFLLIKNSEQRGIQPTLGAREGFQIAILAFGLIRSVSNLWED